MSKKPKFTNLKPPAGWRKGQYEKAMNDVYSSMSEEEVERIRRARDFAGLKPGTFSYDLALHLDMLRKRKRQIQESIGKCIVSIADTKNMLDRCQAQLDSGDIYDELKDGIRMTPEEMKTLMMKQTWVKKGVVRQIAPFLGDLRKIVGAHDIAKKVVLTNEEYLAYVDEVKAKLKRLGHDIFD